MQTLTWEFDSQDELRAAAHKLWDEMKVTGEMSIRPIGDGRWRLELHSEKDVRESALEKIPGKRITVGRGLPEAQEAAGEAADD